MPARPEQHRIEDASRRAFEAMLPEEWVYRQLSHDYGIDGEVEIFSGGDRTGLIFKVQLKGTRRNIRVLHFSHDKAAYYTSLSTPVLIVLHHGSTDRIFARWFQSYDPHQESSSEHSIALTFDDEDELTSSTVDRLLLEMETDRRLRQPATALPLVMYVDKQSNSIAAVASAAIELGLRDISMRLPQMLQIVESDASGVTGSLIIRRDSLTISLRDLATSTVHYPDPWPGEPDPELILHDTMVMLAVVARRLGRYDAAANLFADYAPGSSLIRNDPMIAMAASVLAQAHRIDDAIRILESLAGTKAFESMLLALSMVWTGLSDALTDRERTAVVQYLVRQAKEEEADGDARLAGIAHFNLANRLRVFGLHEQALDHYKRAAELDPTYEERPYFSGEMAGSLFESGRYEEAVSRYQTAVVRGGRERYLPLLGDAQLFSGRFAEAAVTFSRVLHETTASRNPSEWRLKSLVANRIVELIGTAQSRDEAAATALVDLPSDLPDSEARERLSEALHADALCAAAWFKVAILDSEQSNSEGAYIAFVAAAVLSRVNLVAFAMGVVFGLDMQDPHVGDVIRTAYFFNGSQFLHFLAHDMQLSSPEEQGEVLEAVNRLLSTSAPESSKRTIEYRLIQEDGSYDSVQVDLEEDSHAAAE